jgi:hypothetical protein
MARKPKSPVGLDDLLPGIVFALALNETPQTDPADAATCLPKQPLVGPIYGDDIVRALEQTPNGEALADVAPVGKWMATRGWIEVDDAENVEGDVIPWHFVRADQPSAADV